LQTPDKYDKKINGIDRQKALDSDVESSQSFIDMIGDSNVAPLNNKSYVKEHPATANKGEDKKTVPAGVTEVLEKS